MPRKLKRQMARKRKLTRGEDEDEGGDEDEEGESFGAVAWFVGSMVVG